MFLVATSTYMYACVPHNQVWAAAVESKEAGVPPWCFWRKEDMPLTSTGPPPLPHLVVGRAGEDAVHVL